MEIKTTTNLETEVLVISMFENEKTSQELANTYALEKDNFENWCDKNPKLISKIKKNVKIVMVKVKNAEGIARLVISADDFFSSFEK